MPAKTHLLELLPAFVLGCLDPDDQALVLQHLAACPTCQAEVRTYQELAAQLALIIPMATPSPQLQRRLVARLVIPKAPGLPQPPSAWWQRWINLSSPRVWAAASALLILVLVISNFMLWQRIIHLEAAAHPGGMRTVALIGTDVAPGASGYIIMGDDGQNGAFVVDDLPVLGDAWQYQLWLIENGQRVSGAVFSVDQQGYGGGRIVAAKSLFEYSAFGISIEPAGGSPAPSGEKVLGGTADD